MTSVVVSDSGGNIVEYVTVVEEPQQCDAPAPEEEEEIEAVLVTGSEGEVEQTVVLQDDGCPAVIVEEVPSAQVDSECYSAQVVVYGDETYLMQDVAEEQEVVTEVAETGQSWMHSLN